METRTLRLIADRSLAFGIMLSFVMLIHRTMVQPGADRHGIWLAINILTGGLVVCGIVVRMVWKRRVQREASGGR